MRPDGAETAATHVIVLATLGGAGRRGLRGRRRRARSRVIAPEPGPASVATGRATIVDAQPLAPAAAEAWLANVDAAFAAAALVPLAGVVRAHRVAAADPGVPLPRLSQALVARAGYGAGEQVADGRWTTAVELPELDQAPRRHAALRPQERLAALLGGRSHALACEELALRARHDLDHDQLREAALQLRAALDAALVELAAGRQGEALRDRIEELRALRDPVAACADDALGGVLAPDAAQTLLHGLERLEAALRARTVAEDL